MPKNSTHFSKAMRYGCNCVLCNMLLVNHKYGYNTKKHLSMDMCSEADVHRTADIPKRQDDAPAYASSAALTTCGSHIRWRDLRTQFCLHSDARETVHPFLGIPCVFLSFTIEMSFASLENPKCSKIANTGTAVDAAFELTVVICKIYYFRKRLQREEEAKMNHMFFVAVTMMLQTSSSMTLGRGGPFGGFRGGRGGRSGWGGRSGGALGFYGGRNLLGKSFMGGGLMGGGLMGGGLMGKGLMGKGLWVSECVF